MTVSKKEDPQISSLREKVLEVENSLAGHQVTWASTPKEVPSLRKKGVLFSGVLGSRRQYAFKTEYDREQFVYDRHDTLFTVSKDIRALLGLSTPQFKGTLITTASGEQKPLSVPAKKKNRFRKI